MHQKNLRVKMIELCEKLKTKVEETYDVKHPGEREKWQSQQPVLAVTSDMSVEFNPTMLDKTDLTKVKDECKDFVVSLISVARAIKANMYFDEKKNNISHKPIFYDKKQLNQLNRCCHPRDVFSKGENSREHNKRIARAFYGLSEIWPYIDEKQKPVILQLHGVDALIKKFNSDENFRKIVNWQEKAIYGASTIYFDRIVKEQIFQSINNGKLQENRMLVLDYKSLKGKIGRIPKMMDFVQYGERDPFQ